MAEYTDMSLEIDFNLRTVARQKNIRKFRTIILWFYHNIFFIDSSYLFTDFDFMLYEAVFVHATTEP